MYHCDRCGVEINTAARSWAGLSCQVCGIGKMLPGQAARGFSVGEGNAPVPRNLPVPAYQPTGSRKMDDKSRFNYFDSQIGKTYEPFIKANAVHLGRFTTILVPEPERFAWLVPYTGNAHNRCHFTQMLLATVAQAKFIDNGGKFPRLIEPFLGSGQIFLHASTWGPALNDGLPLFHKVIGGDLNGYLIAAFRMLAKRGANAVSTYLASAKKWDADDKHLGKTYDVLTQELAKDGRDAVEDPDSEDAEWAAQRYIWLVNRCIRGTKAFPDGHLDAKINPGLCNTSKLERIREREGRTLTALCQVLSTIDLDIARRDFTETCELATASDIVFMDCPFPSFKTEVPQLVPPLVESGDSWIQQLKFSFGKAVNTYGTDDDDNLQIRIIKTVEQLVHRGTTVILCNFANPGLMIAYANVLAGVIGRSQHLRNYTYTYRSPTTTSEAYQLTLIPGSKDLVVPTVTEVIRDSWLAAGGDNNFDANHQEFFDTKREFDSEEMQIDAEEDKKNRYREDMEDDEFLPEDHGFDINDDNNNTVWEGPVTRSRSRKPEKRNG